MNDDAAIGAENTEAGAVSYAAGGAEPAWLPAPSLSYRIIKRAIDIVFSTLFLILCAPLFLAIAIAIKLDSEGPIFFQQQRAGLRGKRFTLWKFRTMQMEIDSKMREKYISQLISVAANENASPRPYYALNNDPRITRVGQWLRRYSLDELPNFLNVLVGNMSLVGPRPAPDAEVARYQHRQKLRFSCKPGLTGPWQVSGRSAIDFEKAAELDIEYARHPSLWRDLQICLRTPAAVFKDVDAY